MREIDKKLFYIISNSDKDSSEVIKDIEGLLEQGADINVLDNVTGITPLQSAIIHMKTDIAKFLLNKPNLNVNLISNEGFLALYYCIYHNSNDIVELLLKRDDIKLVANNTNRSNEKRFNALILAAQASNWKVYELLAKHPKKSLNTGEIIELRNIICNSALDDNDKQEKLDVINKISTNLDSIRLRILELNYKKQNGLKVNQMKSLNINKCKLYKTSLATFGLSMLSISKVAKICFKNDSDLDLHLDEVNILGLHLLNLLVKYIVTCNMPQKLLEENPFLKAVKSFNHDWSSCAAMYLLAKVIENVHYDLKTGTLIFKAISFTYSASILAISICSIKNIRSQIAVCEQERIELSENYNINSDKIRDGKTDHARLI